MRTMLEEMPVDVRVVCATHQDLQKYILDGRFREDLFYRINEIPLLVPSLQERDGDAILLARAFLQRCMEGQARSIRGFSDAAIAAIEAYPWPGNLRELEHRVKRASIMAEGNQIEPQDLELESNTARTSQLLSLREARDFADPQALEWAMKRSQGNLTKVSELLGISRPSLYTMMKKFGI